MVIRCRRVRPRNRATRRPQLFHGTRELRLGALLHFVEQAHVLNGDHGLANKLQENSLAAVRVLSKRYAEVDRHTPFPTSIAITPIAKG